MGSVGWNPKGGTPWEGALVAPRMGSVGWNLFTFLGSGAIFGVAPRMGSVGWNMTGVPELVDLIVAPRMGSVGWNHR